MPSPPRDELPLLASRHNPRVKQAAELRDSRRRRERGEFLVDGAREVLRALSAGVEPIEGLVLLGAEQRPLVASALAELRGRGVAAFSVSAEAFEKVAFGERADGLVLVARGRARTLAELRPGLSPLVAVLEGVEKPGNLGAVLRSADGAGIDAVILVDPRVDLFNPNAIRASIGSVFRDNIAVADAAAARQWLAGLGVRMFATRPESPLSYAEADFRGPSAILLGSEAEGLSAAWDGVGVTAVSLPMRGVADSLNVSAAAAVLFYEALRQRTIATRQGVG